MTLYRGRARNTRFPRLRRWWHNVMLLARALWCVRGPIAAGVALTVVLAVTIGGLRHYDRLLAENAILRRRNAALTERIKARRALDAVTLNGEKITQPMLLEGRMYVAFVENSTGRVR